MEIKSKFDHFNINVTDLERSIAFYEKALGLKEHHRKEASDGSFTLVYLTDNETGFLLELTWLKDHAAPYELGENESHLCFRVAGDYDAIRAYHKEMNCVCFENTAMGLYFINDPDDYWIEILPQLIFYVDLPFFSGYPLSSLRHPNHAVHEYRLPSSLSFSPFPLL